MLHKLPIILLGFTVSFKCLSQQCLASSLLIAKLDSIAISGSTASHFAELYLQTTIAADGYIQTLSPKAGQMMKRLEQGFAEFFFQAIDADKTGNELPGPWENYFSGNKLSLLQLKLMGANAHINGDIWQALTCRFSLEEIRKMEPVYKKYSKTINKVFSDLFESAIQSDKRLRNLHLLSLGLDKVYGKIMLKKWRNRQLKLAVFKFQHPEKFERLKKRISSKKKRIDRMIIKRLS
jgi:hypothetical protein